MTDKEYWKLEELYLKEKELRNRIALLEDEMAHTDEAILDLNKDEVDYVDLSYTWKSERYSSPSIAFNYPKLLAKSLESYKQELGFVLADLKSKTNDISSLKELILNTED